MYTELLQCLSNCGEHVVSFPTEVEMSKQQRQSQETRGNALFTHVNNFHLSRQWSVGLWLYQNWISRVPHNLWRVLASRGTGSPLSGKEGLNSSSLQIWKQLMTWSNLFPVTLLVCGKAKARARAHWHHPTFHSPGLITLSSPAASHKHHCAHLSHLLRAPEPSTQKAVHLPYISLV